MVTNLIKHYKSLGHSVYKLGDGPFDVIVIDVDVVILIQCKKSNKKSVAEKLIKDFNEKPPLSIEPSHYVQVLIVKVKGEKKFYRAVI